MENLKLSAAVPTDIHRHGGDGNSVNNDGDQAGVLEYAQMPGDRGSTDRESGCDVACCELSALKILEDLPPGGVCESSEYSSVVIHMLSLASLLITIKGASPGVPTLVPCDGPIGLTRFAGSVAPSIGTLRVL